MAEYYAGMDPFFVLIILVVLGVAVGASLGAKAGKEKFTTLSVGEALKPALAAGITGAILGLVIAFLLSLYPIIKVGGAGLYGSFFFFLVFVGVGFAGFFIVGYLYFVTPASPAMKGAIIGAAVGGGLAFLFWTLFVASTGPFGAYARYATTPIREKVSEFFKEVAKFKYCFYADPRCPFFIQWDEPERQSHEEMLNVEVSFSDEKTRKDEINLLVSLAVKNQELTQLRIKPKCYLGKKKEKEIEVKNLGKYAIGDEFAFPLSSEEMHTSFRCYTPLDSSAPVSTYDVVVELIRPVTLRAVWPIYVGSGPNLGRSRTVMPFNAPYSIALVCDNDMPYEEGKSYDFFVVLKRLDEKTELKFLRQIRIIFPEGLLGECQYFESSGNTLELLNVPVDLLRNITSYSKQEEKYSIPCSLYVAEAPPDNYVEKLINVEASYEVVSEYKTQVLKTPA